MTDAALGAEIDVPTIDGGKSKVKIWIKQIKICGPILNFNAAHRS